MAKKTAKSNGGSPKQYAALFYGKEPISDQLAANIRAVEKSIGMPAVLLCQNAEPDDRYGEMGFSIYGCFANNLRKLDRNKPVAVILHSPGGYATAAYKLASLLRGWCGEYVVIVPAYAKSAATLFACGANRLIVSPIAELGPLDAQVADVDREERMSALEVVQSVERLNKEAMKAVDQQMAVWTHRSGKRIDTLLPIATKFVSEMMHPLFDKIDAVTFTRMARVLKVAQDYAETLLLDKYSQEKAEMIADRLTNHYADHDFVLDIEELRRIGLEVEAPADDMSDAVHNLALLLGRENYLGPIGEAK